MSVCQYVCMGPRKKAGSGTKVGPANEVGPGSKVGPGNFSSSQALRFVRIDPPRQVNIEERIFTP